MVWDIIEITVEQFDRTLCINMEKSMTMTNKVLEALENGEELTAAQMTARYGVKNPHEAVRSLRNAGYAVYLNARKNSKGEVSHKYRLGKPTRAVVADRKSTRLNSSHIPLSRMPSSA